VAVAVAQEWRTPAARVIATGCTVFRRLLDLDDLGAEVGKHLRRPGAGEDAREVEHANPVEGHRRWRGGGGHGRDCRRARIMAACRATVRAGPSSGTPPPRRSPPPRSPP